MGEQEKVEVMEAEEQEETTVEEVEIQETPDTPPSPVTAERRDRKIEVIPKITGKKYIANGWYELEEGVPLKVPIHVARLMRQSGAIRI